MQIEIWADLSSERTLSKGVDVTFSHRVVERHKTFLEVRLSLSSHQQKQGIGVRWLDPALHSLQLRENSRSNRNMTDTQ